MEFKLLYFTCPRCSHYPVAARPGSIGICQNCKERLDESGKSLEASIQQKVAAYSGLI
ncbi:MAG: hypothetical protein K1X75_05550 [Leptospirales bacterium]|nr:hypothetical protein [Leptospirales bacterium]